MSELNCRVEAGGSVLALPPARPHVAIVGADAARREALDAFVAARFARAHDATIAATYPRIAALFGPDGEILAAADVRFAEESPLFLETYVDAPIEAEVSRVFGGPAPRDAIVEIGAFSSIHAAASMQLFAALPPWLAMAAGRRFAVATLRPELARTLGRAGFGLRPIAEAHPARLGEAAAAWGRYYAGAPKVYAGRVDGGAALTLLRERLRARSLERQARRAARASA